MSSEHQSRVELFKKMGAHLKRSASEFGSQEETNAHLINLGVDRCALESGLLDPVFMMVGFLFGRIARSSSAALASSWLAGGRGRNATSGT